MPSGSASSTPDRQHSSSSWCQSRPVRASRDISMPRTTPTRTIVTSATSLAKPFRESAVAADTPRSSSITVTCDHAPAQRDRPLRERVLQARGLGVLKHLLPAGLPDVHDRGTVQVLRADLLLRLPLHPVPDRRLITAASRCPGRSPGCQHRQQRYHRGPPLRRAGPPRPEAREPPHSRCPAASGSPAATDSRRRTTVAACNSAPTLSIAPEPENTLETISTSRGLGGSRVENH